MAKVNLIKSGAGALVLLIFGVVSAKWAGTPGLIGVAMGGVAFLLLLSAAVSIILDVMVIRDEFQEMKLREIKERHKDIFEAIRRDVKTLP